MFKFRKPKSAYILSLVAALLVVSVQACNEQMPTSPDMSSSVVVSPQAPAASKLGDVLTTVKACLTTIAEVDIGPKGGTIELCGNTLEVPTHSLTQITHIIMLPVIGHPGAVRFFPEGLQFAAGREPTLTLSTDPVGNPANAYIVYTDDQGNVKEKLKTTWKGEHYVSGELKHFSQYAVAW